MSSPKGQVMEINTKVRDANILHMKQHVKEEALPMPTLEWFLDQGADLPIIEPTKSPFPNSPVSLYYPGRIRIGTIQAPRADKDDADVWVYAYLNKANTVNDITMVEYFKDAHEGNATKVLKIPVDTEDFRSIHFLEWTKLINDVKITCGEQGPWTKRIGILVRIALLLADFFDGKVVIPGKDAPPNKIFTATLVAVRNNLGLRQRQQMQRQYGITKPGPHTIDAVAQSLELQKRKRLSCIAIDVSHPKKRARVHSLRTSTTAEQHLETSLDPKEDLSQRPVAEPTLLDFFHQTQEENANIIKERDEIKIKHAAAIKERDELRNSKGAIAKALNDLRLKYNATEEKIKTLKQDLEKHQATVEQMESLNSEMIGLKETVATQRTKLQETAKQAQELEAVISAQRVEAERDKRFREQHDKEFKPFILATYEAMFLRRGGLTRDEASALASNRYEAICGRGQAIDSPRVAPS
ncbi:Nn.00g006330.m01.CDS01 [Neocucurbitaria sp. VM-36]